MNNLWSIIFSKHHFNNCFLLVHQWIVLFLMLSGIFYRGVNSVPSSSVSVFMPWTTLPPKITMLSHTMTGDTIDIETDSVIHLRCTGQRPMIWIFPNNNSPYETFERYANVNITSNCEHDVAGNHLPAKCSTDVLVNKAKFDMTGYYYCQYNQTDSNHPSTSSGGVSTAIKQTSMSNTISADMIDMIYIFVNDDENLIVPYESEINFLFIAVFQSQPATIPCRPTNSRTIVTLWKVHTKNNVPQQIKPNSTLGITYNPKKGFYFEHPRWDSESNVMECRYELNHVNAISTISLHWSILPSELHPIIDDSNARHIFLNDTFTLRCFVHIEIGVIIVVDWDYPNKRESSRRIFKSHVETQRVNVNGNSYDTVAINITVANATAADQGEYRCNVTDGNGRTFTAVKKVVIYDEHLPSTVNFTTDFDNSQPIVRDVGEDVRFMVVAHAFPDISLIDLSWYKDNRLLQPNDSHYQIEIFSDLLTQISFYIQKSRPSDSGTYTLVGNSSSMTTNISMTIYISGEPEIVFDQVSDFYVLNSSYELICKSYGYPISSIWWSWLPCVAPETCFSSLNHQNQTNWINLTSSNVDSNGQDNNAQTYILNNHFYPYLNVSVLQVDSTNKSGLYRCSAHNKYSIGAKHQQIPFIVMDNDKLFSIISSTDEPTLNDTIVLTCKASIFEYKNIRWTTVQSDNHHVDLAQLNSTNLIFSNSTNQYSHSATLMLRNIQLEDSALFICVATRRNDLTLERREVYLNVKNVSSPSVMNSNMDNEIIEAAYNSQIELKCYISGRPRPTLVWYRNGRQFITEHDSGVRFEDRGQRLIFTRLLEKDSGLYQCKASNRGGQISRKAFLRVKGHNSEDTLQTSEVLITLFLAIIGTVMMIMALFVGKKIREERMHKRELEFFSKNIFENGQMDLFNPEMPLDEQIDLLPYDSRFEFPKERLRLGRTLGQGAFGRVVKAEAIGLENDESSTTVAVKMLKERADANQRKALMAELKILIHLGRHLNIVNLLGAVTKNLVKGELLVIVEFCEFGNLRHFLLSNRGSFVNQLNPETGSIDRTIISVDNNFNNSQTYQNVQLVSQMSSSSIKRNHLENGGAIRYADLLHQTSNDSNQTNDYINTNGTSNTSGGVKMTNEYESPTVAYYNHNYVGSTQTNNTRNSMKNFRMNHFSRQSSCANQKQQVTTSDLVCYAFQCSRGMEYLVSRKLIHRDLAARNVLLASNNVVKICDFGLAKDVYKYDNYVKKDDGPLPIKWMAIESISDKIFTSKSDVWSFGILLWELFTLGKNPYPGVEIDEEFYKRLKNGYRMEKPEFSSEDIYDLMLQCWNANPLERPDFSQIAEMIGGLMDDKIRQHYIDLNDPYSEMNEHILVNSNDYLKMTYMSTGCSEDYLKMKDDVYDEEQPLNQPVGTSSVDQANLIELKNLNNTMNSNQTCDTLHYDNLNLVSIGNQSV